MKALTIFTFIVLFFIGCTSQQSDELTKQQQDQIKSEVKSVNDNFFTHLQLLDERGSLQYFWNSPEFLFINYDGSTCDFQCLKSIFESGDSAISAHKFTTIREEFPIVTKDHVVSVVVGSDQITFKTGEKAIFEKDALTFVYKKIDGNWKIVYFHESATLKTEKAKKK